MTRSWKVFACTRAARQNESTNLANANIVNSYFTLRAFTADVV
jgi:hypothetical protein